MHGRGADFRVGGLPTGPKDHKALGLRFRRGLGRLPRLCLASPAAKLFLGGNQPPSCEIFIGIVIRVVSAYAEVVHCDVVEKRLGVALHQRVLVHHGDG